MACSLHSRCPLQNKCLKFMHCRRKIPPESHQQRNCQLIVVVAAVVATLATSFGKVGLIHLKILLLILFALIYFEMLRFT
jgi:hypothetical protein